MAVPDSIRRASLRADYLVVASERGEDMRYAKKTDANHADIREAFRACGYAVHDFSKVGHGCPDLAVEKGLSVYWVEVKDGDKCPSARKLTPKETLWGALLKRSGIEVRIVTSVDDVLALAKEATHSERSQMF